MNYKAFISYRHSENGRRHAIALETALKRYAKPVLTSPMKIFRDEKHMKPDMSLPKLIQDGLKSSEYLIFLAEKASADSPWCSEELEYWCNPRKLNRAQNLIIVLIGDDIILNTTRSVNFERSTALPPVLRTYLTSIPLYIDLRWATTGTDTDLQHPRYRHEINGLSARLRGVNPEDLNDEEIRVHRRNMRLKNWTLAILLVLLFSALGAAYWANKQQKIAEKESIENYANDLAYKSQTLLAQGERMDAFVLAELAHQYVAADNNKVTKALFDAFYHNDNVDNQILPWSYKLSGHSFGVFSVAFSPDGKFLGTGSGDNTAKVWSLATGYAVFTFKGHTDVVTAVAFSPDGKRFASSSKDNTVKIWDLRSGKQMHTFAGHSGIVTSIAFSPDGKKLASASEDKSVKMWSLETGSIVHSFEGHTGSVTCVAFSPNGSNLTSGSDDKTIRIWDMNGGQDPLVLNAHREGVKCIAYSKDGKYIASGSIR